LPGEKYIVIRTRFLAFSFLAGTLLMLSGCGLWGQQPRITTEAESYEVAESLLSSGSLNLAIEQLEAMESRFPFGLYATQVQLDLIYAHYEQGNFETALLRANRFIRLQPAHPQVDYVYYLRGLTQFALAERQASILSTRNVIDRDVSGYEEAFFLLQETLQRFPESAYREPSLGLMQVARTRMAEQSYQIALYYYQTGQYQAALTRINKLLSRFPGEPIQENTLALKISTHEALSDDVRADATRTLLATEFPESKWLSKDSFSADFRFRRPWYFWLTLGLVG